MSEISITLISQFLISQSLISNGNSDSAGPPIVPIARKPLPPGAGENWGDEKKWDDDKDWSDN